MQYRIAIGYRKVAQQKFIKLQPIDKRMLGQRTVVWAESLHFMNELGLNLHVRPWGRYGI